MVNMTVWVPESTLLHLMPQPCGHCGHAGHGITLCGIDAECLVAEGEEPTCDACLAADPAAHRGEVCHSHDFIDANVSMLDAEAEFGLEFNPQAEAEMKLVNEAWRIAKAAQFDPDAMPAVQHTAGPQQWRD